MNKKNSLIAILILVTGNIFAQDELSIVVKGGKTDFFIGSFNLGGGGPKDYWAPGLQFSGGIEFPLNENFSFQGLIEYSHFTLIEFYSLNAITNDPRNHVVDLMGNIKWNLGIFYFIGGIGFSLQNSDDITYLRDTDYRKTGTIRQAESTFRIGGMMGLGFDVYIYNGFSLIAEAEIRMREYGGTSSVLGIKYDL